MKYLTRLLSQIITITCLLNIQSIFAQNVSYPFEESKIQKWSSCGILFYDLEKNDTIFKYQPDKYFIPASTTKTLTFLGALNYLPDSLTAYKYDIQQDTIYIWGVGNPALANPIFEKWEDKALTFLKNTDKKIVLCYNRFKGNAYGKGWMWDDYDASYQPEINEFPLYGNLVDIHIKNQKIETFPLNKDSINWIVGEKLKRKFHSNSFGYNPQKDKNTTLTYIVDAQTTKNALEKLINKSVTLTIHKTLPNPAKKMLSSIPRDTVLKEMMQESDNFIAEQLHLMICDQLQLPLETSQSITYLKEHTFQFFLNKFEWVDGSGLSRYNLLSPELLVNTFNNLYTNKGLNTLKNLLAIGGQTGTLKKLFNKQNSPYVFAKTGTLTGVFCISGYLICKSGKNVSFALMSNNYLQKTTEIRSEFEKLINEIYLNY